jgi:hypothetical protein
MRRGRDLRVLTAASAFCLVIALVIDASRAGSPTGPAFAFAAAGIVLILAAAVFPHPRIGRRPPVSETPQHHPAVMHAVHLRKQQHLEQMGAGLLGAVKRTDDTALTGLSRVFGWPVTVWLFFALPLAARFLGAKFQTQFFYYSSGWIQLFALPLLTYIGVKLQRSSDAQSEVAHQAMVHIATVEDQNKTLIEQNTELTTQVHALVAALPKPKTLVRKPAKEAGS